MPAGEFMMGSEPEDVCEYDSVFRVDFCLPEEHADYAPPHKVTLSAFHMDRQEVTREHFRRFIDKTGYVSTVESKGVKSAGVRTSSFLFGEKFSQEVVPEGNWRKPTGKSIGPLHRTKEPVVQVSWQDAQAYCKWAWEKTLGKSGRPSASEKPWKGPTPYGLGSCRRVYDGVRT